MMRSDASDRKRAARLAGPVTLGSFLYATRGARGETLADAAKRLGITVGFLSSLERNEKEPSDLMLLEIAKHHPGVDPAWFFALLGRLTTDTAAMLRRAPKIGSLLDELARLGLEEAALPRLRRLVETLVRQETARRDLATEPERREAG